MLCVAHKFIFGLLPWQIYANKYFIAHNINSPAEQRQIFLKIRKKHKEVFDAELCHKSKELNKIFMHVCEARKARNLIDKQYQMIRKVSSSLHNLDYDKCLSLLPDIGEFSQDDVQPSLV